MTSNRLLVWPTEPVARRIVGDDGMNVVAYWPMAGDRFMGFARTLGGSVIAAGHDPAEIEQVFPRYMDMYDGNVPDPDTRLLESSQSMDAVVVLGETDQVWWNDATGHYWHATRADLTEAGRALVECLDAAYGTSAILITHLST